MKNLCKVLVHYTGKNMFVCSPIKGDHTFDLNKCQFFRDLSKAGIADCRYFIPCGDISLGDCCNKDAQREALAEKILEEI